MDDKIIDIESEAKIIDDKPTDAMSKQIEEMNSQLSTDKGEWVWSKEFGLVWQPAPQDVGEPAPGVPSPSTPPILVEDIVKWGNILDFDNIKENAVVLIKVSVDDAYHLQMIQHAIVTQVLNPRLEKLKEKKICVLFMRAGDDISIMDESDMSKAGWTKTNKSLIIDPFKR